MALGDTTGGGLTCMPCVETSECGPGAACVQYAGGDHCGHLCYANLHCSAGETCMPAVAEDGTEVSACVPTSGTCGESGCGSCTGGTHCDPIAGICVEPEADVEEADASPEDAAEPEDTGKEADADAASQVDAGPVVDVQAVTDAALDVQADTVFDAQVDAKADAMFDAKVDGKTDAVFDAQVDAKADAVFDAKADADAGSKPDAKGDAGTPPDAGTVKPGVGPDGGVVDKLYFAVVGDTRPPASNDTNHYPDAIITKIYDDIEGMKPRPQFVVTTGDYMFAAPGGNQGPKQMKQYVAARKHFSGPVFASLGNHECQGGVGGNCAGVTNNNNYNAYLDELVAPLGKTKPYYAIPLADLQGKWTAKLLIVACNAWSPAQKTWLQNELAKKTTYTLLARHEPLGSGAPCNGDMDKMLKGAEYDLLMVGHVHNYSHSGKQLLEGVGGAPLTGSANYGYATVEQMANGGLRVRQYDYKTQKVVSTFTLP